MASPEPVKGSDIPLETSEIEPYNLHVSLWPCQNPRPRCSPLIVNQSSQLWLDRTKSKLELVRLPKDPPLVGERGTERGDGVGPSWDAGVPKAELELLLDFW